MAPKKENKKQDLPQDETGIPKNDIQFKFTFQIQHQELQNMVFMWEWFGNNSNNANERYDAGLIENWEVIKNSSENDPLQTVRFVKEYDIIRVDDEFAKKLCSKKFYVYFVNSEDSIIKEEFNLDYSCLISSQEANPKFEFKSSIFQNKQILSMTITLEANMVLLQPLYRHYLNPLEISIIGGKDLFIDENNRQNYKPLYIKYKFFDEMIVQTHQILQEKDVKFNSKHVFLLGFYDNVWIKEKIRSQLLKLELHDRDQEIDEALKEQIQLLDIKAYLQQEAEFEEQQRLASMPEDPKNAKKGGKNDKKETKKEDPKKKDNKKKDAKISEPQRDQTLQKKINDTNYGVAEFNLVDLLKPNIKNFKLKASVFPCQKYEDNETNNLTLNISAQKEIKKNFNITSYFETLSEITIQLTLPYPIGTFVQPVQQKQQVQEAVKDPKGKDVKQQPKSEQPSQQIQLDQEEALFERAVYIMPYKCKDFIVKFQELILQINIVGMNITQGIRGLTTYALSEQQKKDKTLDYIGGFSIIDSKMRIFLIEGLREKGMKRLEEECFRIQPNNDQFKILKNKDIKFKERLYQQFNIDIKRIKLRDDLDDILANSNLFLRTKVPQSIQDTLIQISELRKQSCLQQVTSFNLFPNPTYLIQIERKYSDSLSEEDIFGYEIDQKKTKKKKKNLDQTNLSNSQAKINEISFKDMDLSKSGLTTYNNEKTQNQLNDEEDEDNEEKNTHLRSLLYKSKKRDTQQYSFQMTENLPLMQGEEINIYSNQRNNWYEKQQAELRERVRNDKNNYYTYSLDYLSLSVPYYDLEEKEKLDKKLHQETMNQKKSFRSLPKIATKIRRQHINQPHLSKIEELNDPQEAYHIQKQKKKEILSMNRGLPLKNPDKPEFISHLHEIKIFSNPEKREQDNITADQLEKEKMQSLKQQLEESKKKCIGPQVIKVCTVIKEKESQTDKYKGLLQDKPKKISLMLKNSQIKNSNIKLTRQVEDLPTSTFIYENYDPSDPLLNFRKFDASKAVSKYDFNTFTKHDVYNNKSIVTKPTKLYNI